MSRETGEGVHGQAKPELQRLFHAAEVLTGERERVVEASAGECAALARRFGYLDIDYLNAAFTLTRWRRKGVRAVGTLKARVTQSCTVTLEPVEETIETEVDALFWPAAFEDELSDDGRSGEVFSELDEDQIPEIYEGDEIDLGELAAEWLAISASPYPRKAGAALPEAVQPAGADDDVPQKSSPFQVLAGLKGDGE